MHVSHVQIHGIYVVKPEGDLATDTVGLFRDHLEPLVAMSIKGPAITGLIVDFSKIDFVNSGGLGYLCAKHLSLKKADKRFIIAGPKDAMIEMFQRANLGNILNIYGDVKSALNDLLPKVLH